METTNMDYLLILDSNLVRYGKRARGVVHYYIYGECVHQVATGTDDAPRTST